MELWQVGAVANAVVALAYFLIVGAIVRPLIKTKQLASNKLGVATAMIFLTCGVHHGTHSVHLVGPSIGYDERAGLALRDAFAWHNTMWDVVSAIVGAYYWSLRRIYGQLMHGAKLFEDLKERQRQALEINDDIVQGLTVAKMALELDEKQKTEEALEKSLAAASRIISGLLGQYGEENRLGPGRLVRDRAATLAP